MIRFKRTFRKTGKYNPAFKLFLWVDRQPWNKTIYSDQRRVSDIDTPGLDWDIKHHTYRHTSAGVITWGLQILGIHVQFND
ncbi:hypothetical protein ES702_04430 [subsurface metagenome]